MKFVPVGTNIKFTQELLGHNDIKIYCITSVYVRGYLGKIESPLDRIFRVKSEP